MDRLPDCFFLALDGALFVAAAELRDFGARSLRVDGAAFFRADGAAPFLDERVAGRCADPFADAARGVFSLDEAVVSRRRLREECNAPAGSAT